MRRGRLAMINVILASYILSLQEAGAQGKKMITGKLTGANTSQAVSFATVALLRVSDSTVTKGAMSDEGGQFIIGPVVTGRYLLRVSNIGYKPATRYVEVISEGITDAGTIALQDTSIMLQELIISGERVKAKAESDRTTYYITQQMVNASATGKDVLKLVPGVQVDMMQNISVEGSRSIMIYVDGRERDKDYVGQLNPEDIDKIEIISMPLSEYDGNLTGAINIVLKKDRHSGIKGQVLAEIPTSRSVVYIFPAYSLNYSFKKINLYTSYNGEVTCLDQEERFSREFLHDSDTNMVVTNQKVRQKNRSNKFHLGFDYFLNDRNQFNFYAFCNPYSQELDGKVCSQISGEIDSLWQAGKDDNDRNRSSFYSLYYKHTFNEKGGVITSDISRYNLKAENSTIYFRENSADEILQKNTTKPEQEMFSVKIDYTKLIFHKVDLSAGFKAKFKLSKDRLSSFEYRKNILAFYTNIDCKLGKLDLGGGLRLEDARVNLKDSFTRTDLAFFPHASLRYRITSRQNLQLTYNRSIKRPNLRQLNPYATFDDPWSTSEGNPFLSPEYLGTVFIQHSVQFDGNYLASRLFFSRADNVINNLTDVASLRKFETGYHNLGHISQYGAQLSGSVKLGFLTLNPFIKIYSLHTSGNNLARDHKIENRIKMCLESGLSAIASFKNDLAFSLNIQYNTPQYDIQSQYFNDPIYYIRLEKTFMDKFKAGIASAIPFTRSFTYNGWEVSGSDFHSLYEGKVIRSKIPVWFRLGYQFSSGKNRNSIDRDKEEIENLKKKGF